MAAITEDYVSFETAKLLKEKGFNIPCHATYDTAVTGGKPEFSEYAVLNFFPYGMKNSDDKYGMVISAPTQAMAMKWLKEEHKIYITISPTSGNGYSAILCDVGDFDDFNYIGETDYFFHPEEAVESGIKYCLENLI